MNIRVNGIHHEVKEYWVSSLCSFTVVYSSKPLWQGQHPQQFQVYFSGNIRNKKSLFERINTGERNVGFHYQNAIILSLC